MHQSTLGPDYVNRARLRDQLRQEFEGTLESRVERALSIKRLPLVPMTPFSKASAETHALYQDSRFYACISLCQAVGEALVRFLCERNGFSPKKDFETNLRLLERRKFIDSNFDSAARELWRYRDDFHHLISSITSDLSQLQQLSESKVKALAALEEWVFSFELREGVVVPKRPKYWSISEGGTASVHLQIP